jgi:3-carboxy-cis,cis-muconate cycloisomerase
MFDGLFKDPDIEALFTDQVLIRAMLRFEGALALAQADTGRISAEMANIIAQVCDNAEIDSQKILTAAKQAGNPAIPLVKELTALVRGINVQAAGYVHAGATSQDVIDSAIMLQLRIALAAIDTELTRLQGRLVELVHEHRKTPLIGRTLLQQARPISLGFKLAGWLDQLIRSRDNLRRVRKDAVVLQFGGAVGTLAASGTEALRILKRLAERLELGEPAMAWHTARDRFFEIASALTMLSGLLGKLATDSALLMQTEIGELAETAEEGRGGSSAMPHKRNPVAPTLIIAASCQMPGLLATIAASMIQEQERAVGHWHAEWAPLAEMVCLTSGAVKQAVGLMLRLKIDAARMRENIELTRGLIYAEDVASALAIHLGKAKADQTVRLACERAAEKNVHLREILTSDPTVTKWLDQTTLDRIFRPENALGAADELINRVLRSND